MSTIHTISERITLIDGFDLGVSDRTGTYVLHDNQYTLIESGPSPSVPHVLKGLETLHINPADIQYLIVTHIHLDHAGGAGLMLEQCPNAKLVVHPRGARHLIDPTRLIEGAKAVYRDKFDRLFDPIVPIPKEKVLIKEDQDTLQIGDDWTLTFYDTPGHSAHHFSIFDPLSNGIFTGDTIGVRYEKLANEGHELVLPSTTPSQFDPEAMLNSLDRIEELGVEKIYFGHFNVSTNPTLIFKQIREWLPKFVAAGEEVYQNGGSQEELSKQMLSLVQEELDRVGIDRYHHAYDLIKLDMDVSSMGIFHYLTKRDKKLEENQ